MKGDGINRIEVRFQSLVDLMRRKNAGYAGASDDEWVNFRSIEPLASAEIGLMARLGDKWNRLRSLLLSPSNDQVNENIHETIGDMINYLAIMQDIIYEKEMARVLPQGRPGQDLYELGQRFEGDSPSSTSRIHQGPRA